MTFIHVLPKEPKTAVGPPTNINLGLSPDGWTLTWDPPQRGTADLECYAIEWQQDDQVLTAFTSDNLYSVRDSVRRDKYSFQVWTVGKDHNRSEGWTFGVSVAPERSTKAVMLGLSLGFVLLIISVLLGWFAHKHFAQKRE